MTSSPDHVSNTTPCGLICGSHGRSQPDIGCENLRDLYFGGDMEAAVGLAGQTAGLINAVKSAKNIIDETVSEFHELAVRMGAMGATRSFGGG